MQEHISASSVAFPLEKSLASHGMKEAALSGGTGRLVGLFGWQLLRNGAALDVGAVGIVAVDLGEVTVHQHRNDHAALIQCPAIAGQYLFRFHQLSSMTQKPF
jgi:hypothetical protein